MDLETENRIAVILMREAAELRRQADKEGFSAYLRDSKDRCRPNSRFLTATVLGVQQANRAVEINEMWRARQRERDFEEQIRKRTRSEGQSERNHSNRRRYTEEKAERDSCSTSRNKHENFSPRDDEGLKAEELEEFLRARAKRGRGDIGSRMDEPGPYLPSTTDPIADLSLTSSDTNFRERWESRVLGPEKPTYLISKKEIVFKDGKNTKPDKSTSKRSSKNSKKHKLKEKSEHKKKKNDKKRKKHRD